MGIIEIHTRQTPAYIGQHVRIKGQAYAIRRMGNLAFVILRDRSGLIQVVVQDADLLSAIDSLPLESVLVAEGKLVAQASMPGKVEMHSSKIDILSQPKESPPVELGKGSKMESLSLAGMFDYRPLTLRNEKVRAIFKIEAALCSAFREFLNGEGFTEIHSPKIVATGTEGGANLFAVDYFGRTAYLAQSPQFYKQIMVGALERVFEIGPVYRAEEHDTSRHLNEYVSMDFEIGFIRSEQDVISMQIRLLKRMFERLKELCPHELALHGATTPEITAIPQVTLEEAARILIDRLGWKPNGGSAASVPAEIEDLDPEGERLLCQHFGKEEGSELVYITNYPLSVRPFYAMPLEGGRLSRSFDLLFRGLEITTGGQRIHGHEDLLKSMAGRRLDPEQFQDYLQCFRYGMPPHGGLAIGLERLTKQLLGLPNVKLASLFPRDRNRLSP